MVNSKTPSLEKAEGQSGIFDVTNPKVVHLRKSRPYDPMRSESMGERVFSLSTFFCRENAMDTLTFTDSSTLQGAPYIFTKRLAMGDLFYDGCGQQLYDSGAPDAACLPQPWSVLLPSFGFFHGGYSVAGRYQASNNAACTIGLYRNWGTGLVGYDTDVVKSFHRHYVSENMPASLTVFDVTVPGQALTPFQMCSYLQGDGIPDHLVVGVQLVQFGDDNQKMFGTMNHTYRFTQGFRCFFQLCSPVVYSLGSSKTFYPIVYPAFGYNQKWVDPYPQPSAPLLGVSLQVVVPPVDRAEEPVTERQRRLRLPPKRRSMNGKEEDVAAFDKMGVLHPLLLDPG